MANFGRGTIRRDKKRRILRPGESVRINGKYQYCLWLVGISPAELRKMPAVLERIEKVRQFRLSSTKEATRKQADNGSDFAANTAI